MIDRLSTAGIPEELAAIEHEGRLRQRPIIEGPDGRCVILRHDGSRRRLINWASNDYLGAANLPRVKNGARRALRRFGAGAGSARLLSGGLRCHRHLEEALARWLDRGDALLTSSGYQANVAVLGSLAAKTGDAIILDRLCHASLYDGARLAAGKLRRFKHNDLEDLTRQLALCANARRRVVCIESVYSMDGDSPPLRDIATICEHDGALLLVDEAHALGIFGPDGRGRCAEAGIQPDILVGTCSKALGAQGGFIAGERPLIELIVNRGRSFIYSTALCPAAAGAAIASLRLLRERPGLPGQLRARAAGLRIALLEQGWNILPGEAPIIPILVGDEATAVDLAARLAAAGHYAPAIRPPTVPTGACRLRLTVTLAHVESDLARLVKTMEGFSQS